MAEVMAYYSANNPPYGPPSQDMDYFSLGRPYSSHSAQHSGHHQQQRWQQGRGKHSQHSAQQRGSWGGVQKHQQQQRGLTRSNGSHTDLQKLRHENAGQARKHFGSSDNLPTPRSVPPAPEHDCFPTSTTGTLVSPALHASGFHVVTPNPFAPSSTQGFWKNSFSTVDKAAAELNSGYDMFGSNAGLIARSGGSDEEDYDGLDDDYELQEEPGMSMGPAARALLEEQAAKILELEERNLNLQERVFLLEQQLQELKKISSLAPSDHSCHSSDEDCGQDQDQENGSGGAEEDML